ncbi:kinesin-like protein KIF16B isoform X2 [Nothobranchius furzeri]|uniref:Transcript variant X2 n=2 Tax=Nothobranchius furzeri TaxID=105023 RepID=A0A9D2Y9R9_NOTFU|nr:transcript variant X2 [Nothobranchius furzeri]
MASVRVAVRVRPMNRREKDLTAKCIIRMDGTKTSITNLKIPEGVIGDSMRERTKTFTYDFSYDSADCVSSTFASQEKVFRDLGSDVLKAAFEGYNACVFAYGQTGSGKSYTMMGIPGDAGLIPRICEGLFSRISEATRWDEASFRTEVSYLEIYNERVRDLLRRKSSHTYNLRVREHPKDGPYVEDLSKHLVQNYSDVEELMEAGNINRTTASTSMNDASSRSHAIFTVNFTQAKFDAEMPCETVSKIHLVDLAGSERADATGATGVRLKEGGNINKSLVTLGNVISALADMTQDGVNTNLKKKSVFVPYRDSVLTWLLKDSLGGNSKTIMIATVSPADVNYGETLSTLRYANRAKNIINKPTINEDANVRLIRELRAEIARLKALLVQGNQIALLDSPTALSMEEKLHQNEARVLELTKEWTNKWNETQNILKEETLALRKEGIGVVLDSELPHLIGIDDDLLSTGIILYHLKEGRTYVGREDASTEQDIILHGLDLESEHCVFRNQNGSVTLVPLCGAQCSVNGVQVMTPTQLNQGAVVLLGRTNMFRFNHPKEAAKLREKRKSGLLSTFSLSMTDLSESCENLSTVMLYNPGLEFERQQREELEKLEMKRRLIKDMEAKHLSEKAELERLQQEVESQRKESEEVQQRILRQEESLRHRSQDIESRLQDFLAEKERFEEERRSEIQGAELQCRRHWKEHREKEEEQQNKVKRWQQQAAEQPEIYRELERLKREREEQKVRMETERRRLEEQEREQLSLVGRLEEQLREKHEAASALLAREDARRLEDERQALAEIREVLLRAKEAAERSDVEDAGKEGKCAHNRYMDFKEAQVKELCQLEEGLRQQRERLEKEVASERSSLLLLAHSLKERPQQQKEVQEKGVQNSTTTCQEELQLKQMEHRLQFKEQQLANLAEDLLPTLAEEKQKAMEVLERSRSNGTCDGPSGLDTILFQVEKELEEKEEKLHLHWHSAQQLQQLQETYEFTTNVARQEDKVRRKEKEILESMEKQQREAMEQAVARLERRHSALRHSTSLELDTEEQRPSSSLTRTTRTEADPDQQRVEREIQKLRQRIVEGDDRSGQTQSLNTPLSDDRINAYIEEEVQRRLREMNLLNGGSNMNLSVSRESVREEEKLQNLNPRRLKYEKACWPNFSASLDLETSSSNVQENLLEEAEQDLPQLPKTPESSAELLIQKDLDKNSWWNDVNIFLEAKGQTVCGPECFRKTEEGNRFNKNKNLSSEGRNSFCGSSDGKKVEFPLKEPRLKECPLAKSPLEEWQPSCSGKVKNPEGDPQEEPEPFESLSRDDVGSKQSSEENIDVLRKEEDLFSEIQNLDLDKFVIQNRTFDLESEDETSSSRSSGTDFSEELKIINGSVEEDWEAKKVSMSRSYIWRYLDKTPKLQPWTEKGSEPSESLREWAHSKQDSESNQGKEVPASRSYIWRYITQVRNQTLYPWRTEPKLSGSLDSGSDQLFPKQGTTAANEEPGPETESGPVSRSLIWDYVRKVKDQTLYPWRSTTSRDLKSQSSEGAYINLKQDSKSVTEPVGPEQDEAAEKVSLSRSYIWDYVERVKNQTLYPWRMQESELSWGWPVDPSLESWRFGRDPIQASKDYLLSFLSGKLSEAFREAEVRLQGTWNLIQSREPIHQTPLQLLPEPPAEDKVQLDLGSDGSPQGFGHAAISGFSEWPEGSVTSVKTSSPEEFHQRLIELPLALSQLQGLSSEKILENMESLAGQRELGEILSIFWVKTASYQKPIPEPVCLLVSEMSLVVVSAGTGPEDSSTLFHHFDLLEIKEVQISLAGQHVRLLGSSEDSVLAVFTYNKELTQEFCKVLLKARAPDQFSEVSESHPLFSGDLMALSLDWTSSTPDITLESGLYITSRFKRVLADLIYVIHENMEGPEKPSLADVHPLLYTSVKLRKSSGVQLEETIFQFLLTDTHVALLQEDGVFHPVPRGSSLVPAQPQFQGLKVSRRSDVRCLLVRREDNCVSIDILFMNLHKRSGEADGTSSSAPDSWKLVFSCSSEAQVLINHLCL